MIYITKKAFVFIVAVCLSFSVNTKTEYDVYKCVDNDDKKIALTFDDGPHPTLTSEILDILEEYNIKATFFVVGRNVDQNPDVLRRITESGHEIGNHTETHLNCARSDQENIINELTYVHEKVLELCDYDIKLFRPPGGSYDNKTRKISEKMKYRIVLWSIDTKDWSHTNESTIRDNILENVRGGSIILFHDYISKNGHTAASLKAVIPDLLDRGYSFVTVGELISEYGRT